LPLIAATGGLFGLTYALQVWRTQRSPSLQSAFVVHEFVVVSVGVQLVRTNKHANKQEIPQPILWTILPSYENSSEEKTNHEVRLVSYHSIMNHQTSQALRDNKNNKFLSKQTIRHHDNTHSLAKARTWENMKRQSGVVGCVRTII
jgi:hypothetical protein